jgi:hypothetical protein
MGKICHDVLHEFYQSAGPDVCQLSADNRNALFNSISSKVMTQYESECPTGYPVEWAVLKEELLNLLREVVRQDHDELAGSNFHPVAFETDLGARLGSEWPQDLEGLPVHGRLDRIDTNTQEQRLRVVDYKFKPGREPRTRDNDLVRSAVRGLQLQPPIYVLLAMGYADANSARTDVSVEAAFYFLAPNWDDGPLVARPFSGKVWIESAGASIRKTISHFLRGIRQGEFFILPGDYCRFCEVSEICRKAHLPSLARAERQPAGEAMKQMRKQS